MSFQVACEAARLLKIHRAKVALVRSLASVDAKVLLQVGHLLEALVAVVADVRSLGCVCFQVVIQIAPSSWCMATHTLSIARVQIRWPATAMLHRFSMNALMRDQVALHPEGFAAVATLEWALACVYS